MNITQTFVSTAQIYEMFLDLAFGFWQAQLSCTQMSANRNLKYPQSVMCGVMCATGVCLTVVFSSLHSDHIIWCLQLTTYLVLLNSLFSKTLHPLTWPKWPRNGWRSTISRNGLVWKFPRSESYWEIMERQVHQRTPSTINELKAMIEACWGGQLWVLPKFDGQHVKMHCSCDWDQRWSH